MHCAFSSLDPFLMSSLLHTHAHTHPEGTVVDNVLVSTPDVSAGTVFFMLKQQERTSANILYGPCLTAD